MAAFVVIILDIPIVLLLCMAGVLGYEFEIRVLSWESFNVWFCILPSMFFLSEVAT